MPPENELKSRVDFLYSWGDIQNDKDTFWKQIGQATYESVDKFIGKRGSVQWVVAQIVSPSDDSGYETS